MKKSSIYAVTVVDITTDRHNNPTGTSKRVVLVEAHTEKEARKRAYRPQGFVCNSIESCEERPDANPAHVGREYRLPR